MTKTLLAFDAEVTSLSDYVGDVYADESGDRARLVDPAEWFKGDVVTDFPYWNDPRIERVVRLTATLTEYFRVEPGSKEYATTNLTIPSDVVAHIRESQRREGTK